MPWRECGHFGVGGLAGILQWIAVMTARRRISVSLAAAACALLLGTAPIAATVTAHEVCGARGHECPATLSGPCCCDITREDNPQAAPTVWSVAPPSTTIVPAALVDVPVRAPAQAWFRSTAAVASPPLPLHILHRVILR